MRLNRPDCREHSRSLAFTLCSLRERFLIHGMLNAYWEPLTFELPPPPAESPWRRWIDTALQSPDDIRRLDEASILTQTTYVVQPHSSVFLALWLKGVGRNPIAMRRANGDDSCGANKSI